MSKYPFYFRATMILLGLFIFSYVLLDLREILIPLTFSLLIAILLNPLCNQLERKKIPKVLAIATAILIAILVISGIMYFLSFQIMGFSDQLPVLKTKFNEMLLHFQTIVSQSLKIPLKKQEAYLNNVQEDIKPYIARALGNFVSSMAVIFLVPVYTFLFLYYKTLLLNFLYEVFAEKNYNEVGIVLIKIKGAIQSYMVGLILEALIIASLNSIALLILGIKYAILLGLIGALLNVLPFIGGILAVIPPLVIATITKDGYMAQVGVLISYVLIQFTDNHFLVPYIVSSQVKINALISIIVVLLGGAVWGVSGMFLSIPFIGLLKIIFDRIPELISWGKLLGNEVPVKHKGDIWKLRRKRKANLMEQNNNKS
jgi:predicted PurR-regulated permease PerM